MLHWLLRRQQVGQVDQCRPGKSSHCPGAPHPGSCLLMALGAGSGMKGRGLVEKCECRVENVPQPGSQQGSLVPRPMRQDSPLPQAKPWVPQHPCPQEMPLLLSRPCPLMSSGELAPQDSLLGILFIDLPPPHSLTSPAPSHHCRVTALYS